MEKDKDLLTDRSDFVDKVTEHETIAIGTDRVEEEGAFHCKKKKEDENCGCDIHYEWKQSITHVSLLLQHGLSPDQFNNIDVEFTDTGVSVQFPGGRSWSCLFYGEIDRESSKVYVKKTDMTLVTAKKISTLWPSLEKTLTSPSSGIVAESFTDNSTGTTELQPITSSSSGFSSDLDSVSMTPMPSETSVTDDNLPELVSDDKVLSTSDDELPELVPDEKAESAEKEKPECTYLLKHVKHDYMQKDQTFVVHFYVKEVDRDHVKIEFEEKLLTLTFKTKDARFLGLHEGTNSNTTFKRTLQLQHEVVPSKCTYRITNVLMEVTLYKKDTTRWNYLEALTRKENITPSKSTWIPTKSQNMTQNSSAQDKSKVVFDELKDVNIAQKDGEQERRYYDQGATGVSSTGKENSQQKPTCKVSPMNKTDMERVTTPGFTGLDNLGNTCFMNSVLQALSNSREFRDFFINCSFQKDINTENPLGSKGQLAVSFAVLLKVLWSGKHYSYAPSKLKNLIAMKASQFTGFAQHDSQEFMAFLLDGLHEDLNRVKKKPYTETVDSDGRPDDVVASQAWEVYKKRNDSFIVDLFQGQYKSKLVCPVCGKVSITFDPFLYLSVPLPKKKRILPVRFMWKDPYKKPVLLRLRLAKDATTETLKESASKETGVPPKQMRVFEAYRGKIYKFYGKKADLSSIQADDTIIIAETLSEEIAGENVYEIYITQRTLMPNQLPFRCSYCKRQCPEGGKLKRCTKCFKVGYCDQTCQKSHWPIHKSNCKPTPEPVGWPFVLSVPESRATYSRICKLMEAYARYSVDVFQPPVKNETAKFVSQSSTTSNLSSSSQSSGSMSSLDSQSSCSSTCTIVADQEKDMGDGDVEPEEGSNSRNSLDAQAGSSDHDNSSNGVSQGGSGDNCTSLNEGSHLPADTDSTDMPPRIFDSDLQLGEEDHDYGETNLPENRLFKMPPVDSLRPSLSTYKDKTKDVGSESVTPDTDKPIKSIPTKPVLGIQKGDADRIAPLFYIKPVDQDGTGLKGPEGERLEDKGDIPLDLSERQFLSMDWKNHEKFDPYVLIQSKEFDCEEDSTNTNPAEENPNITLQQCLELFTEPEILTPDEAWYCPQCKEHREASKQLSIWKLPHTLIIQLKRFSFRNFIWRDKIDKMVEFPVRGLDLSPYFIGGHRPPNEQDPIYDLYAVVNHYGGILGGHYTSFVRCADLIDNRRNEVGWRLCDDSRVSTIINENSVVTRGAYLLFYRRRSPFDPPKLLPTSVEKDSVENIPATETNKITANTNCNSSESMSESVSSRSSSDSLSENKSNIDLEKDATERTPLLGNNINKYIKNYYENINYRDPNKDEGGDSCDSDNDTQDVPDIGYADNDTGDMPDKGYTDNVTGDMPDIGYTDMDAVD